MARTFPNPYLETDLRGCTGCSSPSYYPAAPMEAKGEMRKGEGKKKEGQEEERVEVEEEEEASPLHHDTMSSLFLRAGMAHRSPIT
jgi:hypothetical protein